MTFSYDAMFARLDDQDVASILGRGAVRLIRALDPDRASETSLRTLAAEMYPSSVMLRDERKRNLLLESLPEEEANGLAEHLGLGATDNPWGAITRQPFRHGSDSEAALFEFFGQYTPADDPVEFPSAIEGLDADYGLFEYQRRAARDVLTALDSKPHRTMLHMPTGSGKTRTTMHVACERLRAKEPSLVIWLAFTEELCEQAAEEFMRAWQHLGDRPVNVHRLWGNRSVSAQGLTDGFVILGLKKAFAKAEKDANFLATLSDRASLVVFDEAHQALAPTYRFVLERLAFRHDDTPCLGLSATPGRTWNDPDEDAELAGLFNRNKVTLSISGYSNPVDYLIDDGYLARPEFEGLTFDGDALTPEEQATLQSDLDIPKDLLNRLASDEKRNLLIVNRIEQIVGYHSRIIVFAATVEHAYLLAVVLRARGIESAAVTGVTDRTERARLISRYKSGSAEPQVLCNFGVLTTGFDAPRTSAAFIARPTRSLVLYSQMVGRAIRGPKAGGNKEALVVTVVDTHLPGFGQVQDAFTNWEDVWS